MDAVLFESCWYKYKEASALEWWWAICNLCIHHSHRSTILHSQRVYPVLSISV
jgi:hypothetical protein